MVTDREAIRQELSVHYFGSITQEGIKFGKQQTNAFLYGQRLSTMSQFIENKVPEQSHPQKIKQFSGAMDISWGFLPSVYNIRVLFLFPITGLYKSPYFYVLG